ncbi:MAG: HAMP domain-containing sensor histidine kinase [Planctomycetota bacterium]
MPSHDFSDSNVAQTGDLVQSALDGLDSQFGDLQRQVDTLQRLASVGTMAAMIAHEFNNMLTPIVSYCQYALQRGEPDLMKTALERTLKNAQRLSDLSGKILGLAGDASTGPTVVSLRPLIEDAVACLGRDLEKDSISLTIDVPEGLSATAHASSLQQVLFNLVLNARQAMLDRAGRLTIAARRMNDGKVAIEVADTGPGIKPENVPRVFEPFFSTKRHETRPDRGGLGLGLHVCKRLMVEMDGDISVASEPGLGATFTLTLPMPV